MQRLTHHDVVRHELVQAIGARLRRARRPRKGGMERWTLRARAPARDDASLRVQQGLFAAATYLILLAICLLAIRRSSMI